MIERRQQEADHGGVHALERGLHDGRPAHGFPEGQRPHHQQDGGQEHGNQASEPHAPAAHDGAEIGREGEEGSGDGLGRTVTGQERIVPHPTRRHDFGLQQRQHHVTAAEHQRAGAVEGGELGQARAAELLNASGKGSTGQRRR